MKADLRPEMVGSEILSSKQKIGEIDKIEGQAPISGAEGGHTFKRDLKRTKPSEQQQ